MSPSTASRTCRRSPSRACAGRGPAARPDRRCVRVAAAPPLRRPAAGAPWSARAACAGGPRCSTAGPTCKLIDLRGNVETRLRKLDEQGLDAIILAEAGLSRLGLEDHITEILDPPWMLPAVGQGALGLECRTDDGDATRRLLAHLDDAATPRAAVRPSADVSRRRAAAASCRSAPHTC